MTTERKLIEKLKELVEHVKIGHSPAQNNKEVILWKTKYSQLNLELSALEKELAEQKSEPALSAEEILNNYGCPPIPFEENVTMYYPAILEAMEEYRQAGIREVLVKFNSWMCKNQFDGRIPLINDCIDEYLNGGQVSGQDGGQVNKNQ